MKYNDIYTAPMSILSKQVRKRGGRVKKYCKANFPEFFPFAEKRLYGLKDALDNKFLPVHYIIKGGFAVPISGDIAAECCDSVNSCDSAEKISAGLSDITHRTGLYYGDVALLGDLRQYVYFTRLWELAEKYDKAGFKKALDSFVFPRPLDLAKISAGADPIEKMLSQNEDYAKLSVSSKSDCKKQIAMVSHAADISEDRLCMRYITEHDTSGADIAGQARDDFYRVFPPPRIKNYLQSLFLPSVLIPSALALITANPLYLLLFLPLYGAVKAIADRHTAAYYSKRDFLPPRIELDGRIPEDAKTLCVISALLTDSGDIQKSVKKAKEFLNKNRTDNLQVCILSDLPQSDSEECEDDRSIYAACEAYSQSPEDNIFIFLRPRVYNEKQKKYMGYERKRGAIEQLAQYFCENKDFCRIYGKSLPEKPVFFLALDYDTNTPIDGAASLVSIGMAKANRPVISGGRMIKGYGVIAPKMSPSLFSCLSTRFAEIFGGNGGGSGAQYDRGGDFYMTVFGEGIFCGKGLIDLEAFYKCCCGALPENKILSHDIIEGGILRCAASDAEFTESFPADSTGYFTRLSRWWRGDVQNSRFIFSKNIKLCGLDRFKLFDNLIRAITPIFTLLCLYTANNVIAAVAVICAVLPFIPTGLADRKYLSRILSDGERSAYRVLCEIMLIAKNGADSLFAAVISLWRMIRNKNLLCWVTAFQVSKTKNTSARTAWQFLFAELFSLPMIIAGIISPVCFIAGVLNLSALPVFIVLDKRKSAPHTAISDKTRAQLVKIAAAELSFFLEFTTEKENHLPPDNVQLSPKPITAHRTSPTNIGMYLLALYSALELDIIAEEEYKTRTRLTLLTVRELKKWRGHLYNWYDTVTLQPLDGFVSSVDSGNLLCCLTAVKQGIKFRFPELYDMICDILRGADMGAFYNSDSNLLAIGYDSKKDKLTENCYDLLMSEARMASYYGIAKGQLPPRHWRALSRVMGRCGSFCGGLSWSGTAFEYFMPQLVLPAPRGGLLYENLRYAIHCQKKSEHDKIYGISESGFYAFDKELCYQYRAFGVPYAALRPDFYFERVYSPYSAFLMLAYDFDQSYNLLCRYREKGIYNKDYGFYEAVDFSGERTDKPQAVKSFMAHHKGMSIAGIANALCDNILVKRFMSDEDMERGREMTEERISGSDMLFLRRRKMPRLKTEKPQTAQNTDSAGILSNGRMSVFLLPPDSVDEGAAVHSVWSDIRLFYPPVFGQHDSKNTFSSFEAAVCENEHRYNIRGGDFSSDMSQGKYSVSERELDISEKIMLASGSPTQIHEYNIVNHSSAERRLNLTIFMRPALGREKEVTAHPAFADLFIGCDYDEEKKIITVCRRHRQSGEQSCMAVALSAGMDFYCCFDRESADRKKPLYENNLRCVPAPCVYISVPVTLKKEQSQTVKMYICCAHDIGAAKEAAGFARGAKSLKTDNANAPLSEIIARAMLPSILLSQYNKNPTIKPEGDFSRLWAFGINTDRPAAMFYCTNEGECLYAVLKAARRLVSAGLDFSLILICCGEAEQAEKIKQSVSRSYDFDRNVTVLSRADLSENDIALLEYFCCYRADSTSPITEPIKRPQKPAIKQGFYDSADSGFTEDGGYRIAQKPPVPWSKVLANPTFGALVHYNSLGFCWAKNSSLNTLNPWDNDITGRNKSALIYLKTEKSCTDILKKCVCTFYKNTAEYNGMTKSFVYSVTVTVPKRGQAEIIRVNVTNKTDKEKTVSPIVISILAGKNVTSFKDGCLCAKRVSVGEFSGVFSLKAFGGKTSYGTDRENALCGGLSVGFDGDCLAAACELDIKPHRTESAVFIVSYCSEIARPSALPNVLTDSHYRELLAAPESQFRLKIKTEDKKLDYLMNIWLPDQIIKGRIFARTGFYQNGGAYGFRDQLQDGMAAVYHRPEILKYLILRSCGSQFDKGDVLHWYHVTEKGKKGVRTACSDDMLWLPFAACHYARVTGDYEIFKKDVKYATAPEFMGEEIYTETGFGKKDSVINHCLAAADYAYKTGSHGLCLMGGGDWNDSYNFVGAKGKGESVWLSMFCCMVYDALLNLPAGFVPDEKKAALKQRSDRLKKCINENAYENGYYLRAFYDDGEKMGGEGCKYCEIDLLAQAFAVLSDLNRDGDMSRSRSAVNLALSRLADYDAGLIKLFTPPFAHSGKDNKTGYVCSYPKGVRENGGQYTHAAVWLCMAVRKLGYPDEAYKLLKMLNPAYKDTDIFKNEPYYMTADVYTNPDCYGRGGWSIYTGAAAWYYRAVLDLLGIDIVNGKLVITHKPPAGLGKCEAELNGEKFVL